jgi:amino acid transporter
MAAGVAHDGLFPRPLRRRVRGRPVPALVLNTILATALIAFDATGDPLALFTTLALLSTFVYVFGYDLSVAAELCHSLARRTRGGPPGGHWRSLRSPSPWCSRYGWRARRAPRPCSAARC